MPTYYMPGKRNNNQYVVVRGYVDGKQHEIVTDAKNKRDAEKAWNRWAAEIRRQNRESGAGAPATFALVADAYMAARGSSKNERRYIERLKKARIKVGSATVTFGDILIEEVLPMHIAAAANAIYPTALNETKNRQAYTPAASVLHFAHANKLRDYVVIEKLPEREPETKRPAAGVVEKVLENVTGDQYRLLVFLACQGWRITETLSLRWENVDLNNRLLNVYVSKAKRWKQVPMHEEVFEILANAPKRKDGRVFPWETRSGVYKWLWALNKRLGVHLTPHMLRHEFGGALREMAATARDLTDVGTWTSEKSTARYQHAGSDHARAVIARRKIRGKTRGVAVNG